jgi:hypothetical protein
MHRQFEVWRNVIECNMSMRTQDVAGLRRCVETFTHYVSESPDLAPWLEIARAHLALSLGKPQEALAGYSKWLERIQPGSSMCWDTLCFGYADALLASNEAVQARTWLLAILDHPVVKAARRTSSWATLEATLALAEAECDGLDNAQRRIQALEIELEDSDHPLLLGFVHEVAARIAGLQGDQALAADQLNKMKRWYTVTRNPALMMRGQRVHDSLQAARARTADVPPRKSSHPPTPPAAGAGDRDIVTRVTTRREDGPALVLVEPVLNEEHERLLQVLLAAAGTTAGALFALYDGQPQLLAAKPAALAQEPLYADELKQAVAKELECSGGASTPDAATGLRVQVAETVCQLHWLRDHETQRVVAACLLRANENGQGPQPRQLDPRLLAETASSLLLAAFGARAR